MRKFLQYLFIAFLGTLPAIFLRFTAPGFSPVLVTLLAGGSILSAGFMLSWSLETAEKHVTRGVAVAVLAIITVLPEYAVDLYYTWQAGHNPASNYVQFAAANMTGANRLLVGAVWPLIALLFWFKSGQKEVKLDPGNGVEITFLALASVYSFVIIFKGQIDLFDTVILLGIYGLYIWRVSKLERGEEEEVEGPAEALEDLPVGQQKLVMAGMAIYAALVILLAAEPFAEALVQTGRVIGINEFFLIQWVAPLAGEAPEIILTILFTLALKPTVALGALVSDKINQWTLLVGMIPLIFSLAGNRVSALPLDARQHEEFFLTAAQSIFAVSLLLRFRLTLKAALLLLAFFLLQPVLGILFRRDEQALIATLTILGWIYLVLAGINIFWNRSFLINLMKNSNGFRNPGRD